MDLFGFTSKSDIAQVVAATKVVQRMGLSLGGPSSMKYRRRLPGAPVSIINDEATAVPGEGALLEVTSYTSEELIWHVEKPTATGVPVLLALAEIETEEEGCGVAPFGDCHVAVDTSSLTAGDRVGPQAGEWYAAADSSGAFVYMGEHPVQPDWVTDDIKLCKCLFTGSGTDGGGGGGSTGDGECWVRKERIDVTTTTQTILFEGLNGDSDQHYKILSRIISASATASTYNVAVNLVRPASLSLGANFAGVGHYTLSEATLQAETGAHRVLDSFYTKSGTSATRTTSIWADSSTNITALEVVANTTDGIGEGSYIELWVLGAVSGGGGGTVAPDPVDEFGDDATAADTSNGHSGHIPGGGGYMPDGTVEAKDTFDKPWDSGLSSNWITGSADANSNFKHTGAGFIRARRSPSAVWNTSMSKADQWIEIRDYGAYDNGNGCHNTFWLRMATSSAACVDGSTYGYFTVFSQAGYYIKVANNSASIWKYDGTSHEAIGTSISVAGARRMDIFFGVIGNTLTLQLRCCGATPDDDGSRAETTYTDTTSPITTGGFVGMTSYTSGGVIGEDHWGNFLAGTDKGPMCWRSDGFAADAVDNGGVQVLDPTYWTTGGSAPLEVDANGRVHVYPWPGDRNGIAIDKTAHGPNHWIALYGLRRSSLDDTILTMWVRLQSDEIVTTSEGTLGAEQSTSNKFVGYRLRMAWNRKEDSGSYPDHYAMVEITRHYYDQVELILSDRMLVGSSSGGDDDELAGWHSLFFGAFGNRLCVRAMNISRWSGITVETHDALIPVGNHVGFELRTLSDGGATISAENVDMGTEATVPTCFRRDTRNVWTPRWSNVEESGTLAVTYDVGDVSVPDGDTTPTVAEGTDFGRTTAGSADISHSFTMTATTNPVGVRDAKLLNETAFSISAQATNPINMSDQFEVTLDTAVAGTYTDTVTIPNSTTDGSYTFDVIGVIGDPPCISCDEGQCSICDEGACSVCDEGVCSDADEGPCSVCDEGECDNGDQGACTSCDQGACNYCDEGACDTCDEVSPCNYCDQGACTNCDEGACTNCDEGACSACDEGWCGTCDEGICDSDDVGPCTNYDAGPCTNGDQGYCGNCDEGYCYECDEGACYSCDDGICASDDVGPCTNGDQGNCTNGDQGYCDNCDEGACSSYDEGACTNCDEGACTNCDEGYCGNCDEGWCGNCDEGICDSDDVGPCTNYDAGPCTNGDQGYCGNCDEGYCYECDEGACDNYDYGPCTNCDEGPCTNGDQGHCDNCDQGYCYNCDEGE